MSAEKLYFPNLNGIRCVAALLVIIYHIEQIKSIYNIQNYAYESPFIDIIGHLGVILFFVLSGFLITYLLLMEEKTTNKISVRQFYMRRILRIWPLYFLVIVLALFVLPNFSFFTLPGFGKEVVLDNLTIKIILYLTFFANMVLSFFGIIPYASQTWSIGTEEQFYLIWPIIIKYIKRNRILLMILVVIVYVAINLILNSRYSNFLPYKKVFTEFWTGFSIDCMAIGGFFAVLSFQGSKFLKLFLNKYLFYVILTATIILIIIGFHFPLFHDEIYAVMFGIIILNFATNRQIKLSLENKVFNYLGKISYGLYMFHPIAVVVTIKIGMQLGIVSNYYFYPVSVLLTILISGVSYKYFEKKFLSYKMKFSSIISGDNYKKD